MGDWGRRDCYPSGRKYHYIANFHMVRLSFPLEAGGGGVGENYYLNGEVQLYSGFPYNLE